MLYFRNSYLVAFFALGICLFAACSKMDHTYSKIITDGEVIYTGKADSARAYPGNGRVALSWLLLSDPKITYCRVFWNEGKDSLKVPVTKTSGIDTIRVVIDSLAEGTYSFSIFTGDNEGHRSVETHIAAHVYGDQYADLLSNRTVEMARWTDGEMHIIWQHATSGVAGMELNYTDQADREQGLFILPGKDTTTIADYKEGTHFEYRTLYLPDTAAIDTFHTDFVKVTPVFETRMDKSKFAEYDLPGDAVSGYGWVMSRLWDDKTAEPYGYFANQGTGDPYRYTFDLGQVVQLSRYKVWQRGVTTSTGYLYAGDNPDEWEIWGATDPATDGSYDGWTKLMTCVSVKPSGLPLGTVSDEDRVYAAAGEEYVFPDSIPPVRYIRIKLLATWGGRVTKSNTMEMTFWRKIP
jgi:hypothetical protein